MPLLLLIPHACGNWGVGVWECGLVRGCAWWGVGVGGNFIATSYSIIIAIRRLERVVTE